MTPSSIHAVKQELVMILHEAEGAAKELGDKQAADALHAVRSRMEGPTYPLIHEMKKAVREIDKALYERPFTSGDDAEKWVNTWIRPIQENLLKAYIQAEDCEAGNGS